MTTTAYTDGACLGNPGPGGWAWAVPGGAHASGAEAQSTNQRMEVTAALEALRALAGPLLIVSDSTYVVNCFTKRWYVAWERKGWRASAGSPVANQDLWRPMVEIFHARGPELSFEWIKGHSDNLMNDVVDRLAVEAARTQIGRSGTTPPVVVGPPDSTGRRTVARRGDPGGAGAAGAEASGSGATGATPGRDADPGTAGHGGDVATAGHVADPGTAGHGGDVGTAGHGGDVGMVGGYRVVVLGHRPPALGGYADNLITAGVRRRLAELLGGLAAIHPDIVVLTGLGLGAEQLGALAAADAGVGYVAVLAFPESDARWPAASRAIFRGLLDQAAAMNVLATVAPADVRSAGRALGRRDDWLVAHADGAIVVWDGKDAAIGDRVRALERRIPDDVWIVDPSP